MSNTKKIKAGLVLQDPSEFVGHAGTLFYNPDTGTMYLSDGVTPGGISLGQGGGGGGFSGNYNDLTHKPNLNLYASTTYVDNKTTYANITGKPSFATVATTGNYNDLTNKPTIPSITGLATESFVNSALSSKVDSTSLALVATSGNYNDLEYRPTISTVGHTGNYNDLTNKPSIPSVVGLASESFVTSQGYITSSALNSTLNDYATKTYVGTQNFVTTTTLLAYNYLTDSQLNSRNYITLSDVPTIPTNISELNNDSGFVTSSDLSAIIPDQDGHTSQFLKTDGSNLYWDNAGLSYNDLNDLPTIPTLPTSANGYLHSTIEGVLSWDTPTISTLTDGTITDSQIFWSGGANSSLVDEPDFSRVSLITDQNGDSNGYIFGFGYDGILRVPGQIYDVNGNPVINREAQFEYKEFSDFDAEFNKRYIVRTQNNPVTVTLPSTALAGGEAIFFADAYNTFSVENPLIITGGYIGDSNSDTFVMDTPGSYIGVFYTGNGRWRVYAQGPVTGGGNFSGSYNDLTNKPSLFSGDYNDLSNPPSLFSGDYNDLTNPPSIPSSLSDLGITAGSDGQVLTLNSSLIPVWSTPSSSGGATDRLVNGDYSFVLDEHGGIVATNGSIGPTQAGEFGFGADAGANAVIKANGGFSTWIFKSDNTLQLPAGGDIVDSNGTSVLGGGGASTGNITFSDTTMTSTNGSIYIGFEPSASPAVSFSFTDNGILSAPTIQTGSVEAQGSVKIGDSNIATTDMVTCPPNVDTIVYTGTNQLTTTIKALFHVEGVEDGTQSYEAQSCEMMVAQISGRVAGSVYGLAYTSTTPLATFNARIDSSYLIEITCRPTSTTETVYVRTHATEMYTTP